MRVLRRINFVLVTALSLAAAIPKLARLPSEVEFFSSVGLGKGALVMFGALQLAGGVLLVFRRTRLWGSAIAALAFVGSAAMLFSTGQILFGAVSLLPACMACALIYQLARTERAEAE